MSATRIPLQQVFRSKRQKSSSVSSSDSAASISSNSSTSPAEEKVFTFPNFNARVVPITSTRQQSRASNPFTFAQFAGGFTGMSSSGSPPTMRGTRTPQMLEYERQAEERAREMAQIEEDRSRMQEEMDKMVREQERIAQEEYEMRQYYETEALRHAEEMRLHKEEVRRHQERVRDHERRIRDHEASSEAFAKVIVMPAKGGRQISFTPPAARNGNGVGNGVPNGANGV